MWTINDNISRTEWEDVQDSMILPSDTRRRPDANHILNEEWEEAETAKHELEQV